MFAEKPLAVRSEDCAALGKLAAERGLALGTGHNFLFAPAYERLMQDVASGRLGRLDQVDIVWNKPLPQVQFGPFGGWLFKDSRNILFEVGPHSFAHLAHLLGGGRADAGRGARSGAAAQRSGVPPALGDPGAAGPGRGAAAVLVHRRVPRALRARARLGRQRDGGLRAVAPTRCGSTRRTCWTSIASPPACAGPRTPWCRQGRRWGRSCCPRRGCRSTAGRTRPASARRCAPSTRGWPRALPWIGDWAPTWPGRR